MAVSDREATMDFARMLHLANFLRQTIEAAQTDEKHMQAMKIASAPVTPQVIG